MKRILALITLFTVILWVHECTRTKHIPPELKETLYNMSQDEVTLSKIIAAEANPNDIRDNYLVGSVILNRIENNQFPNTLLGVISQRGQFDGYKYMRYRTSLSDTTAVKLIQGLGRNCDVLYFYNPKTATDKQFIRLMRRKHKLITATKKHLFYGIRNERTH